MERSCPKNLLKRERILSDIVDRGDSLKLFYTMTLLFIVKKIQEH
jgi:hypothetical protein